MPRIEAVDWYDVQTVRYMLEHFVIMDPQVVAKPENAPPSAAGSVGHQQACQADVDCKEL